MKKLNVLVVGSGGREHALAWKIKQSPRLNKLYVAPGNAGTYEIAVNVPIQASEILKLAKFAKTKLIDLTVVGPDDALAAGIVDVFSKKGLAIFGPTRSAAKIESSKEYSKFLMTKMNIPTANFRVFRNYKTANNYLDRAKFPLVIKASGLALGKGVFICKNLQEAQLVLETMMLSKKFGKAGETVVIEEYLEGPEVSIHAFCDSKKAILFPPSQDNKPVFDDDKGPNTGGMGTIAPIPWFSNSLLSQSRNIVNHTIKGLKAAQKSFMGVLYPGLKVTKSGLKVLEFNARFGDPECQSYMRLLKTDLLDILEACTKQNLKNIQVEWKAGYAVCIVLCSDGYPEKYETGFSISGLAKVEKLKDIVLFHAGTKFHDNRVITSGGRVLNITAIGVTLEKALSKAYKAVGLIHFKGMHYRKDIGAPKGIAQ